MEEEGKSFSPKFKIGVIALFGLLIIVLFSGIMSHSKKDKKTATEEIKEVQVSEYQADKIVAKGKGDIGIKEPVHAGDIVITENNTEIKEEKEEKSKKEDDKPPLLRDPGAQTPRFVATNEPPVEINPTEKLKGDLLRQIATMRQNAFFKAVSSGMDAKVHVRDAGGAESFNNNELGNYDATDIDSIEAEKQRVYNKIQSLNSGGGSGSMTQAYSSSDASLASYDANADGISAGSPQSYAQMKNNGSWQLTNTLQKPTNKLVIRTGTVIPATLITGINSDLPGQIIAQVSQNVYDTSTGNYLLIPQGARLVGTYASSVTYGQERVMIAWQRIIYPDDRTLDIGSMPGADQAGYAGVSDLVNNHWWKLLSSAFLVSGVVATVTVATDKKSSSSNNSSTSASDTIRETMASELGNVVTKVIERNLNISPTLEIRPGYKFNVTVTKDLTFSNTYQLYGY